MQLEIIISDQYVPYLNLAVEQSLVNENPSDTAIMYLWKNYRTVVIGLNQNPYTECNVEQLLKDGGYLMRRTTGGGAVYHDLGNLNFSFVAPERIYDQTRQFSVLQQALRTYGLETEISGRNDLLYQGRKFSGNAFSAGKKNRLHHGTLLIRTEVEQLQRYLKVKPSKLHKHGVASVESRIINLSEVADITSENVVTPLVDAFQDIYGEKARIRPFSECCTESVRTAAGNFASEEFLFGRWKQFNAKRSGSFPWGEIEIDLEIDETSGRIRQTEIATDCLRLDIIAKARKLVKNSDIQEMPHIDTTSGEEARILNDILQLIYA